MEKDLLNQIDLLVKMHHYPNRSRAIQEAVREHLKKLEKARFERECAKLNSDFERRIETKGGQFYWPKRGQKKWPLTSLLEFFEQARYALTSSLYQVP